MHRTVNRGFLWTKVMKSVIFWSKHTAVLHTKTRDYLQFTGVFIKLPLWSRFWWKVRKQRHPLRPSACLYPTVHNSDDATWQPRWAWVVGPLKRPSELKKTGTRGGRLKGWVTDACGHLCMWSILYKTANLGTLGPERTQQCSSSSIDIPCLTLKWGWNMTQVVCDLCVCLSSYPAPNWQIFSWMFSGVNGLSWFRGYKPGFIRGWAVSSRGMNTREGTSTWWWFMILKTELATSAKGAAGLWNEGLF